MKPASSFGFARTVLALWQAMAHDLAGTYRPELHYMRGPGPKCREKLRAEAVPAPVEPRPEVRAQARSRQSAPQAEPTHALA